MGNETAEHVYDMLMKNFERVYSGEEDDFGDFQPSNRPPWGLYMHAAWFFGDYSWHFEGYKMFLEVKFKPSRILEFYFAMFRQSQIALYIQMSG